MGIRRDFQNDFLGKVGTVEGGDGAAVRLAYIGLTVFVNKDFAEEKFGCPAGLFAILATWAPADAPSDGVKPITFPRRFGGKDTPVYYADDRSFSEKK